MSKIIIETFMSKKLGLNGNGLVMFAIMWAEWNGERNKEQPYDYNRFSGLMNVTVPTVYSTMKKLVDAGYVRQRDSSHYELTDTWG